MSTISLITDFGLEDNFAGVMKAVILKIDPYAGIVDVCHGIRPQDTAGAAFLLKSSYSFFPEGSVHLVVVDPGVGSRRKKILVKTKNYFFIGPDNGVLSLALKEEKPLKIIEITRDRYFLKPASNTFHGRDIFAPVSAYISKGEDISAFGRPIKHFKTLEFPSVKRRHRRLIGEIIYVDRFGNLVTNIDSKTLSGFTKNKRFKVFINGSAIQGLSSGYYQGSASRPIALIDSFGYLEIALGGASARDYFSADRASEVTVALV